MLFSRLADAVLILHLAFVLFVVLGGLLVFRWRRLAYLHLPIAIYGVVIEVAGFVCPLTPLEVWLRRRGGESGYEGGFVEHYIMAALYPSGLTREIQWLLAAAVLLINTVIYSVWWRRRRT